MERHRVDRTVLSPQRSWRDRPRQCDRLRRLSRARRESPRRYGEHPDARIQVDHVAASWHLRDDVGGELIEQVAVSLKERQHVTTKRDGRMTVDGDRVGDMHVAVSGARRRQTGQAVGRREPLERPRGVDRFTSRGRRDVEVHDTLRGIDILRELDFPDAVKGERVRRRDKAIERVGSRRQQLTCLPRIAHLVRALAKKPDMRPRTCSRARIRYPSSGDGAT